MGTYRGMGSYTNEWIRYMTFCALGSHFKMALKMDALQNPYFKACIKTMRLRAIHKKYICIKQKSSNFCKGFFAQVLVPWLAKLANGLLSFFPTWTGPKNMSKSLIDHTWSDYIQCGWVPSKYVIQALLLECKQYWNRKALTKFLPLHTFGGSGGNDKMPQNTYNVLTILISNKKKIVRLNLVNHARWFLLISVDIIVSDAG